MAVDPEPVSPTERLQISFELRAASSAFDRHEPPSPSIPPCGRANDRIEQWRACRSAACPDLSIAGNRATDAISTATTTARVAIRLASLHTRQEIWQRHRRFVHGSSVRSIESGCVDGSHSFKASSGLPFCHSSWSLVDRITGIRSCTVAASPAASVMTME